MGKRVFWRPGLRFLVRHQDEQIVVVEKKAGLLSQATDKGEELNLFALLRAFLRKQNPHAKLYPVHRLDRVVSGLLVFAKTKEAQAMLTEQFRQHRVRRVYYAAAQGRLEQESGTLEGWLRTDDPSLMVRCVSAQHPKGRRAITHFELAEYLEAADVSVLEVELETGLRNQIRVQFADIGHPLLGEKKYAGGHRASRAQRRHRIFLHAGELEFVHPNGKEVAFGSELPPDLVRWLARLEEGPCPEAPRPSPRRRAGGKRERSPGRR